MDQMKILINVAHQDYILHIQMNSVIVRNLKEDVMMDNVFLLIIGVMDRRRQEMQIGKQIAVMDQMKELIYAVGKDMKLIMKIYVVMEEKCVIMVNVSWTTNGAIIMIYLIVLMVQMKHLNLVVDLIITHMMQMYVEDVDLIKECVLMEIVS